MPYIADNKYYKMYYILNLVSIEAPFFENNFSLVKEYKLFILHIYISEKILDCTEM